MASQRVMAIGDSGKAVRTRVGSATGARAAAMGPGNICVPASLQWMAEADPLGGGVPTEVLSIKLPGEAPGVRYPYIEFRSTPHAMYRNRDGSYAMSDTVRCSLLQAEDADHPIFARLPAADRDRLRTVFPMH